MKRLFQLPVTSYQSPNIKTQKAPFFKGGGTSEVSDGGFFQLSVTSYQSPNIKTRFTPFLEVNNEEFNLPLLIHKEGDEGGGWSVAEQTQYSKKYRSTTQKAPFFKGGGTNEVSDGGFQFPLSSEERGLGGELPPPFKRAQRAWFAALILTLLLPATLFAQSAISPIPSDDSLRIHTAAAPVELADGKLCVFRITNHHYRYDSQIIPIISSDYGESWAELSPIYNSDNWMLDIAAIRHISGNIIIAWQEHSGAIRLAYSQNETLTWSEPLILVENAENPSLSQTPDGTLWLFYKINGALVYRTSTDGGFTWQEQQLFLDNYDFSSSASLAAIDSATYLCFYDDGLSGNYNIRYRKSTDKGATWGVPTTITTDPLPEHRPRATTDSEGNIFVAYFIEKQTPFTTNEGAPYIQKDIYYIKSTDNAQTWSEPTPFTTYEGTDINHNITLYQDEPFVTFGSNRYGAINTWFGTVGQSIDTTHPSVVHLTDINPKNATNMDVLTVSASIEAKNGIQNVEVIPAISGEKQEPIPMYDDGTHGDPTPNDNIFHNYIGPYEAVDSLTYFIRATDSLGNTTNAPSTVEIVIPAGYDNGFLLDANNFAFEIHENGFFGDDAVTNRETQQYRDMPILFSGGFYLSAKMNGERYANGVFPSMFLEDYRCGETNSHPNDPRNNLYVLKQSDPHFSESWQQWRYAVQQGATFIDGDGDGIYNPIDKNGNGHFDIGEDAPLFLSDLITWSVYTDDVDPLKRRFRESIPLGIEIRQTTFLWSGLFGEPINDIIFVKYELTNTGNIALLLDSVYFSIATDPDIGDHSDDLIGTDRELNTIYAYNDGEDEILGEDAPKFGTMILAGPPVYITGVTYTDNNNNNQYDHGIDTPLQYATYNNGASFPTDSIPGAKNAPPSSTYAYFKSNPDYGDPQTMESLISHLQAKNNINELLDPCTFPFGEVFNKSCESVDPKFIFSGNLEEHTGWIQTTPQDMRMLITTGPFQLHADKPITIIAAYVARKKNPSVLYNLDRTIAFAQKVYNSNFRELTGTENTTPVEYSYKIHPNYPNPFNPSTTLSFEIPEQSNITIEIYNILGEKIETLIKKEYTAGVYSIDWDASNRPSGIYIARITSHTNTHTKHLTHKMLLLK